MDYKHKYLKYKLKYLNEKKFIMEGGGKASKKCDKKKAEKAAERKQARQDRKQLQKTQKAAEVLVSLGEGVEEGMDEYEWSEMKKTLGKKLELELAEMKQQELYKKLNMTAKHVQLQNIKERIVTTGEYSPASQELVVKLNVPIETLNIEINTVSNTEELTKLYEKQETQQKQEAQHLKVILNVLGMNDIERQAALKDSGIFYLDVKQIQAVETNRSSGIIENIHEYNEALDHYIISLCDMIKTGDNLTDNLTALLKERDLDISNYNRFWAGYPEFKNKYAEYFINQLFGTYIDREGDDKMKEISQGIRQKIKELPEDFEFTEENIMDTTELPDFENTISKYGIPEECWSDASFEWMLNDYYFDYLYEKASYDLPPIDAIIDGLQRTIFHELVKNVKDAKRFGVQWTGDLDFIIGSLHKRANPELVNYIMSIAEQYVKQLNDAPSEEAAEDIKRWFNRNLTKTFNDEEKNLKIIFDDDDKMFDDLHEAINTEVSKPRDGVTLMNIMEIIKGKADNKTMTALWTIGSHYAEKLRQSPGDANLQLEYTKALKERVGNNIWLASVRQANRNKRLETSPIEGEAEDGEAEAKEQRRKQIEKIVEDARRQQKEADEKKRQNSEDELLKQVEQEKAAAKAAAEKKDKPAAKDAKKEANLDPVSLCVKDIKNESPNVIFDERDLKERCEKTVEVVEAEEASAAAAAAAAAAEEEERIRKTAAAMGVTEEEFIKIERRDNLAISTEKRLRENFENIEKETPIGDRIEFYRGIIEVYKREYPEDSMEIEQQLGGIIRSIGGKKGVKPSPITLYNSIIMYDKIKEEDFFNTLKVGGDNLTRDTSERERIFFGLPDDNEPNKTHIHFDIDLRDEKQRPINNTLGHLKLTLTFCRAAPKKELFKEEIDELYKKTVIDRYNNRTEIVHNYYLSNQPGEGGGQEYHINVDLKQVTFSGNGSLDYLEYLEYLRNIAILHLEFLETLSVLMKPS